MPARLALGCRLVGPSQPPRFDWRPRTRISLGQRAIPAAAEPMSVPEGSAAMLAYARRHRRMARRVLALMGHRVDGSDAGFEDAGRHLRFVRLVPRPII